MTVDWWTLGFQVVNVAVLVWLLRHFFWRPVAAMIAQRRDATVTALADAKAAQDKAAAALAEVATTRAGFAAEHDAVLASAHTEAQAAGKAAQAASAKASAAQAEAAQAHAAAERAADEAAWTDRASALAVAIAGRLAARLQGPAVTAAFLDWLETGIQAMPAPARKAAAADDGGIETVSARPLAQAEQERARSLVAAAFGTGPRLTFRTDPALIAGIELHGPHFALTNSWQADLAAILKDLRHAT
jgi:F-type H+-transporting ATPase subunit b